MMRANRGRENPHPLVGRRLGVVGRAGSGRTTLAVLLARELTKRGYQVCFLEADARSAGSYRAFGLNTPPEPLLEFLAEEGVGGPLSKVPYGDQEIQPPVPVALADLPETVLGRTEEGIAFLSLERARLTEPEYGQAPVWAPRDLRIEGDRENPVTLIKLEASPQAPSPDLLASLDWVLVVVDPSFYSVDLATEMGERVVQIQKESAAGTEALEPTPGGDPQGSTFGEGHHMGILAVLNHIPDPETEQFFVTAISQQAHIQPIGAIREDWEMSDAGLHGRPVPEHKAEARVRKLLDRIEESESHFLSETMA